MTAWLTQLSKDKASKYLSRYAATIVIIYFIAITIGNDFGGSRFSALPLIIWSLVWWNSYKQRFTVVFKLTIFWLILQTILVLVLTSFVSSDFYYAENPFGSLFFGALLTYVIWAFPFVVSKEFHSRLQNDRVTGDPSVLQDADTLDVSVNYDLFKSKNNQKRRGKTQTEPDIQNNQLVDKFDEEHESKTERSDAKKTMSDLEARYKKGRLAIQFRDDAKKGWEAIKEFPTAQKLQYLKLLSEDPKREVDSIVMRLTDEYRKTVEPFDDPKLNDYFRELGDVSPAAALEFKEIVDTLGDTIEPTRVRNIILKRRGKIGQGLIEHRDSLKDSLRRSRLPNRAFQLWFADEFDQFATQNGVTDRFDPESWRLFIEGLYSQCEWDIPHFED